MRVAFRADASVAIGSGHVMRCLTLAHALNDRGAEILFVSREHAGHLCDYISEQGFAVARLPFDSVAREPDRTAVPLPTHADWLGASWEEDANLTKHAVGSLGNADWLVVDHYALDSRWEAAVRPATRRLMVVDDLADRRHECDLLLDQNYYPDLESRYEQWVPTACGKLLGPGYALLRPELLSERARLPQRTGTVRRILVLFGGVDPSNETKKAIDAFLALGRTDIDVDVVVGGANPHRAEIEALCGAHPNLHFHCRISNMAEMMAMADLSIGAGGSTSWERCCLGLPAIVIAVAANQVAIAEALAHLGVCRLLGEPQTVGAQEIAAVTRNCLEDPHGLREMSIRGMRLVRGNGSQVVSNAMAS